MNEDSAICLEMVQIKQQLSGRQSIQAMLSILPTASRKRPTTERKVRYLLSFLEDFVYRKSNIGDVNVTCAEIFAQELARKPDLGMTIVFVKFSCAGSIFTCSMTLPYPLET